MPGDPRYSVIVTQIETFDSGDVLNHYTGLAHLSGSI